MRVASLGVSPSCVDCCAACRADCADSARLVARLNICVASGSYTACSHGQPKHAGRSGRLPFGSDRFAAPRAPQLFLTRAGALGRLLRSSRQGHRASLSMLTLLVAAPRPARRRLLFCVELICSWVCFRGAFCVGGILRGTSGGLGVSGGISDWRYKRTACALMLGTAVQPSARSSLRSRSSAE